jgi:hypothetical protein
MTYHHERVAPHQLGDDFALAHADRPIADHSPPPAA